MDFLIKYFEVFYYIFGGIGLFAAGFGGFRYIKNKSLRYKIINKYKKLFPYRNIGLTFDLVKFDKTIDGLYLLDKRYKDNEEIHWIASPNVLSALGYGFIKKRLLKYDDFKYLEDKEGEIIDFYDR